MTHVSLFTPELWTGMRYAARWSKATQEASVSAYVPLSFNAGEAYRFDWSQEVVLIDGVTTAVKVALVRFCHSRMPFVRAYPRETQEMVFDAHDMAFAFFGGTCARGIYDNKKTAVDTILSARIALTIAGSSRRAGITWPSRSPARLRRAGRRARSRTRSA